MIRLWPTRRDYNTAMQVWHTAFLDPALKNSKALVSNSDGPVNYGGPDNLVCLYHIDEWMIRFFCRGDKGEFLEDIDLRYQALAKFYEENKTQVSALVPINYISQGIRVDFFDFENATYLKTDLIPIVRMPYIKAPSLGTFVASKFRDTHIMNLLCDAWLCMIREMEALKMAHGDLDLTNIRVQFEHPGKEIVLKLIDYDNTYIPYYPDYTLLEYSHEPFQHPSFFGKSYLFNHTIDRFAALVIYISLKAIALHPDIYKRFGADADTRLLFTATDYKAEQHNAYGRIAELRSMSLIELEPYIDELCLSLHENRLPSNLDSVVPPSREAIVNTKAFYNDVSYNPVPKEVVTNSTTSGKPHEIVFCYARADEDFLQQLKKQLAPLKRGGLINIWCDRDISAGTDWASAIDEHLNTADIILLLVSRDFIASDYCYGTEMMRALERHNRGEARVIPIILRPIGWQDTLLGKLQALPKDGKPIIHPDWRHIDLALHDIENGIRDIIKQMDSAYQAVSTTPMVAQEIKTDTRSDLAKNSWID